MPIYRLFPIPDPENTNWDLAQNHGEVVVRAKSSGDARLVAAEAEAATAPGRNENDDVYSVRASAFTDEKLYGVQQITDSGIDPEGSRAVIAGEVGV